MDKMIPDDRSLLDAAIDTARALGVAARVVQEPKADRARADALLGVKHGGRETRYAVEVKRALRPATLGVALHQLERLGKQAMLVADYVAPALADELRAKHIPFLDAVGNAYLEQPGLLIWVKGQKPAIAPVAPVVGRAFQPTGLQVVFTLLCKPEEINRPYRELAKMSGVAHGTVGWVIPDLQQMGYVRDLKGKRGTRRLFDQERLLNQWTDAYARVLRPRLLLGRYYVPALEGWKDWPLAKYHALWGGEPAAAQLTDYLRPGELTLYAEKMPAVLAARQRFRKDAAPGHAAVVEVRKRFWDFSGDDDHADLVPPLLVYADLMATGDARCIETAKMIHETYVARLFKED